MQSQRTRRRNQSTKITITVSLSLVFLLVEDELNNKSYEATLPHFETLQINLINKIERITESFESEKTILLSQLPTVIASTDGEIRQEQRLKDHQNEQVILLLEKQKQSHLLVWKRAITETFITQMRIARRQVIIIK